MARPVDHTVVGLRRERPHVGFIFAGPHWAFRIDDEDRDIYFGEVPRGLIRGEHVVHRTAHDVLGRHQHFFAHSVAQAFRAGIGEHGIDKPRGVLPVFRRAIRADELLDLFGLQLRTPQEAVHGDERRDAFRRVGINTTDDGGTHAMADERGLPHVRIAHHGQNRAGEVVHSVIRLWLVALAVARQVDENQPRVSGQRGHLFAPESRIARPTVDEHDGTRTFAFHDVVDLIGAEGCKEGFAFCRRLLRAGAAREQQDCSKSCDWQGGAHKPLAQLAHSSGQGRATEHPPGGQVKCRVKMTH